jgi:quercetin dioxygenase-like cupin family protein
LHNHPDNESMGVVLEGALEMTIGEETSVLRAGDVWHHPPGVFHSTRALEPTLVAEFHHPLRDDLMQLLSDGSDR